MAVLSSSFSGFIAVLVIYNFGPWVTFLQCFFACLLMKCFINYAPLTRLGSIIELSWRLLEGITELAQCLMMLFTPNGWMLGVWLTKWGQSLSKVVFEYLPPMLSRGFKCCINWYPNFTKYRLVRVLSYDILGLYFGMILQYFGIKIK